MKKFIKTIKYIWPPVKEFLKINLCIITAILGLTLCASIIVWSLVPFEILISIYHKDETMMGFRAVELLLLALLLVSAKGSKNGGSGAGRK